MLTEYHGRPVAGGTYPALIWKAFMEKALPYKLDGTPAASFPQPPYLVPSPRTTSSSATGSSSSTTGTATTSTPVQLFTSAQLAVAPVRRDVAA